LLSYFFSQKKEFAIIMFAQVTRMIYGPGGGGDVTTKIQETERDGDVTDGEKSTLQDMSLEKQLLQAVRVGDHELLAELLKVSDILDEFNCQHLYHYACRLGYMKVVQLLVERVKCLDVNAVDATGPLPSILHVKMVILKWLNIS
jgi:hypothetical protein